MNSLLNSVIDRVKFLIVIIVTASLSKYEGLAEHRFQGQTPYCGVTLQESPVLTTYMDELVKNPWFAPIYKYNIHEKSWEFWSNGILINNSTVLTIAGDDTKDATDVSKNIENYKVVLDVEGLMRKYDFNLNDITTDSLSQVVGIERVSFSQQPKYEGLIGEARFGFAFLHLKQQLFQSPFTLDACVPLPYSSNQSGSCNLEELLPPSRSMINQFGQLFALHALASEFSQGQEGQIFQSFIDNDKMKLNNISFTVWEDEIQCKQYWYNFYDDQFPTNVFCLEVSPNSQSQVEQHPHQLIVLGEINKISTPHFIAKPFVNQTFVAGFAVKPVIIHEEKDVRNESCKNCSTYFFRPVNVYFQGMLEELSGKLGCDPSQFSKGSKSTCEYDDNGWPYSVDSKVKLQCKKHYVSKEEIQYRRFRCNSNKTWSPQPQEFGCKIDCGRRIRNLEPLVVRGWPTTSLEFPWYGAIYLQSPTEEPNKRSNYDFICGSTLISESVLVTAAHCFYSYQTKNYWQPGEINIILGSNLRDYEDAKRQGGAVQVFSVRNITIHPNFNPATLENDIALIKLQKDVEVTDYVLPACFPYAGSGFASVETGIGEVAGMGKDENGHISKILKAALLPVVNQSKCEKSLGRHISPNTQLCAGYTNGTGTCKGDSGSGLVFSQGKDASIRYGGEEPERFYIHGIVSNSAKLEGTNECDDKNYIVFTKISAFVEWVQETINKYELNRYTFCAFICIPLSLTLNFNA